MFSELLLEMESTLPRGQNNNKKNWQHKKSGEKHDREENGEKPEDGSDKGMKQYNIRRSLEHNNTKRNKY